MTDRQSKFVTATAMVIAFAGCGSGSDNNTRSASEDAASLHLISSFPGANQADLPLNAQLKLQFDGMPSGLEVSVSPLSGGAPVRLVALSTDGELLRYSMQNLTAGNQYRVSMQGDNGYKARDFVFSTVAPRAAAGQPPTVLYASTEDLPFPVTTDSSFHFGFSEWLDTSSLKTAKIQLTSADGQTLAVDSQIKHEQLKVTALESLPGGGQYSLSISGLRDAQGDTMADETFEFAVTSLGEMTRINVESYRGEGQQSVAETQSALIGSQSIHFNSEVGVYLGDPVLFDGYNPIVIKKGTQFEGSALNISLNGDVPTSLQTETLRFTVLNHAIGYIWKNQYANSFDAPQSLQLTMDLAVHTDNTRTNALLTQKLLGIQATGTATIVGDQYVFDINAATHLDLLETAGVDADLTLRLKTTDINTLDFNDFEPPKFVNMTPANAAIDINTQKDIRLYFNEALYAPSVASRIKLHKKENPNDSVAIYTEVNGAEVVLHLLEELETNTSYAVTVSTGIEDLAANASLYGQTSWFSTRRQGSSVVAAPRLTAVYPGVTCALIGKDLVNDIAGTCHNPAGSGAENYSVFTLRADHPIELHFSQPMVNDSVTLAHSCDGEGSVRVERVDWSSGSARCLETVSGVVSFDGVRWRMTPDENLMAGANYQLVVHPGNDGSCGPNEVCGENGLPLDTSPLDKAWQIGGGSDLVMPFVAESPLAGDTFQDLVTPSTTDWNGDHVVGNGEVRYSQSSMRLSIDLCNSTQCVNPNGLFGRRICDFPGDPTPSEPKYSCNADEPMTSLGLPKVVFTGDDLLYNVTNLPISLEETVVDPITGSPYIPVRVPAAIVPLTGFEIAINTIISIPVKTGPLILRLRQEGLEGRGTDPRGRIIPGPEGGLQDAQFEMDLDLYLDAPNLAIPTGGYHNLINSELSTTLVGPISFSEDGRMILPLHNRDSIKIKMKVGGTFLGAANGEVVFEIAPGEFKIDLMGTK